MKLLKARAMKAQVCRVSYLFYGSFLLLLGMLDGYAQPCDTARAVAEIVSLQGEVYMNGVKAQPKQVVCLGDLIEVGTLSRASLKLFATETILRIDQGTQFRILDEPVAERKSLLELLKGILYIFSREPRELDVYTEFGIASIEGTEFLVQASPQQTLVSVIEGRVLAANDQGELSLSGFQSALMREGQAPQLIETINPQDAVQWALYYRPVLDALYDPSATPTSLQAALGTVDYRDIPALLAALDEIPATARDDNYHIYRAALLMAVGRIEPAQANIAQAQQLNPANGDAAALSAIIAVTQNDKAAALKQAEQAITQAPQSAAAQLALSYALQADFKLDEARNAVRTALINDPDNALAYARLSELWLASGEFEQALQAAEQASELNPNVARTQTVLGFANLTRVNLLAAMQAFNNAIELDPATPLPRLGLGLAKIRNGELAAGREQIAIAVSLDPLNSLFRSYLGKAYDEENRNSLVTPQYQLAKSLDPFDPTPWLYQAISQQAANRPVEALRNLEQSIKLNDNRAVYRSQFLLDEDLAVRSANLGQVYQDLGFERLATLEAAKSVEADPSNHSGHRLLSESYANLPRHGIARVSELLQAQLRQPLTSAPLQPQLAETDLFILEDAGPREASFNEFTPLFTSDGLRLQTSAVIGNNNTWGTEIIPYGLFGNFAFSLGQFHYESDGIRDNNDQEVDIYNAFAQYRISPNTSIQAEYRYFDQDKGDLRQLFDSRNILTNLREKINIESFRVGFHHQFSPNSEIIGYYKDQQENQDVLVIPSDINNGTISAQQAEIQYLYNFTSFKFIGGLGYLNQKTEKRSSISLPDMTISFEETTKIRHKNAYAYLPFNYSDQLTGTIGLSIDSSEGGVIDRDQLNPKFGLIWNLNDSTTFRIAGFRSLGRPLIEDQTIEPTTIGGFSQFLDDNAVSATDAWRYGVGFDKQLSTNIYVGSELSHRHLNVPVIFSDPMTGNSMILENDFKEDLISGYAYWALNSYWTLSAEYQYERFKNNALFGGPNLTPDLKTHKFTLGAKYSHPSGITFKTNSTYVYQKGVFSSIFDPNSPVSLLSEDDEFWIVDIAGSYRVEKNLFTFGVKNLFDNEFNFQDTDPENPKISPERTIFASFTLSF